MRPPVFFFCLSFVCLERKRYKTEVPIGSLPCCPMEHLPHPMGRVSPSASQALGPACLAVFTRGHRSLRGGQGNNNQLWSFPCGIDDFLCVISHFLFSSFSGLPKCRTAGTGRLGRECSGFGSDGNGYTAQVTLFLACTSGQRCQSVCTSRACRTSNSRHFWSIYSEPG